MSTDSQDLQNQFLERLIKENYEMLEALKKCVDMLPALNGFDPEDRKFLSSVIALIAKVEGEP